MAAIQQEGLHAEVLEGPEVRDGEVLLKVLNMIKYLSELL